MIGFATRLQTLALAAIAAALFVAFAPGSASAACFVPRTGGMDCKGGIGGNSADFAQSCTPTTVMFQVACKTRYEETTFAQGTITNACYRNMLIVQSGPEGGSMCYNDAATALQICKDLGYQGYKNIIGGRYKSPSNNGMIKWIDSAQRYYGYNAKSAGNSGIVSLVCYRNVETNEPAEY